jgi:hypothetical protein
LHVRDELGLRPGRIPPKQVERAADFLDTLQHEVAIQADRARSVLRLHIGFPWNASS